VNLLSGPSFPPRSNSAVPPIDRPCIVGDIALHYGVGLPFLLTMTHASLLFFVLPFLGSEEFTPILAQQFLSSLANTLGRNGVGGRVCPLLASYSSFGSLTDTGSLLSVALRSRVLCVFDEPAISPSFREA